MPRVSKKDYIKQYFEDHLFYVEKYFDSLLNRDRSNEFKRKHMALAMHYLRNRNKRILSSISPKKGHFILDLGCGVGTLTVECARRELFTVGIDFSDDAVKIAKNLTHKLQVTSDSEIICADVQRLPFVSNVFDVIIGADLVEHLYRDQYRVALNDWFAALKSGGEMVIYTDNPNFLKNSPALPFRLFSKLISRLLRPTPTRLPMSDHSLKFGFLHVDYKSASYLSERQRQAGFEITNCIFYLDVFTRQAYAYFLMRIYECIRALPIIGSFVESLFCAHLSVVAKKSS